LSTAAITVLRCRCNEPDCSTGRPLRTAHGDGFSHRLDRRAIACRR